MNPRNFSGPECGFRQIFVHTEKTLCIIQTSQSARRYQNIHDTPRVSQAALYCTHWHDRVCCRTTPFYHPYSGRSCAKQVKSVVTGDYIGQNVLGTLLMQIREELLPDAS